MAVDLGRKVGPFSVAGWAGIGVAGVGLGLLLKRSGMFGAGKSEAEPEPEPETVPTYTGGVVPVVSGAAPDTGTTGRKTPTDNLEWSKLCLEYLVADGQDPIASQQALALFLFGDELTPQQAALVSMALKAYGLPPDGAPPMVVKSPGTSTPAPEPEPNRNPSSDPVLRSGMISPAVEVAKAMLTAVGFPIPGVNRDVFDEGMVNAVSGFQREWGLGATGVLDQNTWNVLRFHYGLRHNSDRPSTY